MVSTKPVGVQSSPAPSPAARPAPAHAPSPSRNAPTRPGRASPSRYHSASTAPSPSPPRLQPPGNPATSKNPPPARQPHPLKLLALRLSRRFYSPLAPADQVHAAEQQKCAARRGSAPSAPAPPEAPGNSSVPRTDMPGHRRPTRSGHATACRFPAPHPDGPGRSRPAQATRRHPAAGIRSALYQLV